MKRCKHPSLHESYEPSEYVCDSCKTLGFGLRQRCDHCSLAIHEYCATCPERIHAAHLHPGHHLALARASPDRICDVCGEDAEGVFFQCAPCNFDVHPLCTQLPAAVRHQAHAQGSAGHELRLRRWNLRGTCCLVCRLPCEFWWYRCERCAADIHPECLVKPLPDPAAAPRGIDTRSLRPAHPAPPYAWPPTGATKPPWPPQPAGLPVPVQASCSRENPHLMYYYHFIWHFYGINMNQQHWSLPPAQAPFPIHSPCRGTSQFYSQFYYSPTHHKVQHYHHHRHPQPLPHYVPSGPSSHCPQHQSYSCSGHPYYQAGSTSSGFALPSYGAHVGLPHQWGNSGSPSNHGSDDAEDDGPERRKKKKTRKIYALVGRILLAVVTTGLLTLI